MDALLQSFVRKVHTHSLTAPQDVATIDSVHHLLSVISRPNLCSSVAVSALGAIHSAVEYDPSSFLACDGPSVVLAVDHESLPHEAKMCIVRILALLDDVTLVDGIRRIGAPWVVPRVMTLHTSMGEAGAHRSFELAEQLLIHGETRGPLLACRPITHFMQLMTTSLLDHPSSSHRALNVINGLVHTRCEAQQFWRQGGSFLIQAIVRHRKNGVPTHGLLKAVSNIAAMDVSLANESLAVTEDLALIFMAELDEGTDVQHFIDLTSLPGIGQRLMAYPVVLQHYVVFLLQTLGDHTPDDKLCRALCQLNVMIPMDRANISFQVQHHIYRIFGTTCSSHRETSLETRIQAAIAVCKSSITESVARIFPSLLEMVTAEQVELDVEMLHHVECMIDDPAVVVRPLRVHGHTGDVLFHTMPLIVGKGAVLTTSSKTSTRLRQHLEAHVRSVLGEPHPHPALVLYCRELIQTHGLDIDAVPEVPPHPCTATCPVTMEHMHCPVAASDGHTYELQALVEVHRNRSIGDGARSPMTRESLESWVVYNRRLVETETAIAKPRPPPSRLTLVATDARRRRRFIERRGAPV